MTLRVLQIGGTGLVGGLLAERLVASGIEVHALLRRASGRTAAGWHEHLSSGDDWPRLAATIGGDVAVSALGTTMRAAGSRAAFRAVDHDLVAGFAAGARKGGARHMILVSSVGADPASRNFYLRVKGETERAVAGLGFERLDIVRPGLLRGHRPGEQRLGERLGIWISPLLDLALRGPFDRYAAIDAADVAGAIAALVGQEVPGHFCHHNRDLLRLARR